MCPSVQGSLSVPVSQNLHEYLKNQYPGLKFQDIVKQPVHLTGSEVTLDIPDNTPGWRIVPDRKPVKVSEEYLYSIHRMSCAQ